MRKIINIALDYKKRFTSIERLIDFLDVKIVYIHLETLKACTVKNIIFLSYDVQDYEKDFIIAHELGHIILHDEQIRHFSKIETFKGSREETQANLFATVFLGYKYNDVYTNDIQRIVNNIYCNYLNDF